MARKDHSRHYFSWPVMAVLLVLVLTVFCTVLHQMHGRTRQLETQAESMRLLNADKKAELDKLELTLQRVDSDGYVENVARKDHDFIRKGEIRFQFDNPDMLEGYTIEEYQFIMDEMRY